MGKSETRAVAPVADQKVRVDNVKDESWISAEGEPGLIGQIFFATDDATVDADVQTRLDAMAQKYAQDTILNPTLTYPFFYLGYADHRASDKHNKELSQRRADAVEVIVRRTLFTTATVTMQTVGLGVDDQDPRTTTDSKSLASYRRVDIIGPKLRGIPPPPPPPPPPRKVEPKLSRHWQARMRKAKSLAIGVYQGDHFCMDIVDLDNHLREEFVYKGLGMGKSPAPIGFSYSPAPSDWKTFTTTEALSLSDFEGFAFHFSGQAQISFMPGVTGDVVILTLAHARRRHSWVILPFGSFTTLDPNAGLGGAVTGGTLEPMFHDNAGGVPWSEGDKW